MDNRPISELERANAVYEEDILLISQKENDRYVSRKIGAGVFKGDSAYDLAVKEGFTGNLVEWLTSIKGWQPITSGEFIGLLDSELDKSTLYLDLKTTINTSTSELRQEINKQLSDISNLKDQVVAEADKRIKEIHDLNSGLIEEANKRIQDIQVIQQSITLESDERLRQAAALADKLLEEKEVRTQEIKNLATKLEDEQNDRIFEIENIINDLNSEVAVRREMIKDAVDKITKEAEERVQALNAIQESITKDQQERLVEIENILQSIDALDTQVGTNHSYILNNYSTTKQANELTATQIEALKTTYIDPQLEQKASTTALQQITTEVGKLDEGLKANIKKVDGVFAQVNPNMAGSSSGSVGQDSSFVGVWTEQSARIEEDFALGQRINNVVATYTSNKGVTDARIAQEEKVRADADSALASIVTSLTSKVGDSEGKILTLQEVNTEQNKSISQISSKLDNTVQALDTKASSSALTDLTSNVEVLEDKVESSTSSITLLKNSLNVVEDGLSKKADGSALSELASKVSVIDGTLTSTNSSVTSLTSSVGTKNRTYYQTTTPTETLVSGDLWVNSSAGKNNEIKRYNGTSWVAITDPRTATNSSAISSLQTTTTQNQDSITTQGRLITDLQSELDLSKNNLLLKADASALNDLSSKVTSVDGKVTSVSQDLLELHNNLTSIEEGLELKAEASALRDLTSKVEDTGDLVRSQSQDITSLSNSLISIESEVDTKGRVIYSDNEPSQEDRINNNLWIDTSGGKNTPKMWDGVSWVAVSDKVATDALKQAELNKTALTTKADSSAVASLTNKVEAVEKNITSQSTDLVVLKNSLEEVSTVSNDKGKVIFSSTQPKDADKVVQNLWIDTSDNKNTPKRWTGTQWAPVTDKVALDALAASNETLTKLNTKADASAVSSLDSKVTKINETLTSQSTDITTLNNSLVVANDKLSTKGKIIYSDSTPVEGDRLPQNLWIDTKGGGNIPKRWNGEFWLVVTDKTAVDALAAANQAKQDLATKVDSSAFNSLSSQVTSAEQKISSQSDSITKLNNSLEMTDEVAKEALAGVTGLTQQITTKASTEALENLSSSVTSIDGQVQANTQKVIELSSDIETIEGDLATKVDASVLVDYSTKMSTEEAISKASTSLTSSYTKAVNDSKADTDLKLDDQLLINKVSSSGKLLFTDVTFLKGTNSVSMYDNKNTGKVRVDRITKESDNPTKSTHQLKITIAEGANPNYGGFYQAITSRANATFVIKYLMKVPVDYKLAVAGNALGTGSSDKIIGSNAGTGRYETYIRIIRCGSTGTFSTGGHLSFRGTNLTTGSTDTIMLASIETWDATDFIRAATSDEVASINASLINDYYTIAAADKAISNSLTAFKTNYVDQELNKKASANTVEQITNEINNTETGLKATANKLSGVFAQVNPEFVGTDKGYIGKDSGSVSVWSEYSARIEGDTALSSRIDSVKSEWENSLAVVQTQTQTATDKLSSLASQVTVLSSAVDGNLSLVMDQYYTKVQTNDVVSQNIVELKANYISPQLGLKASAQALQETQSQVTEIDGKLKTTSQKTDGVYAQINPELAGNSTGSIGNNTQKVGAWTQYSALIEGDFATAQKIDAVSVEVENNSANIQQINTAVVTNSQAAAEALSKVEVKFNDNLASLSSTIGTWTEEDKSISKYITDLTSVVDNNKADISKYYLTSVDTTKAITEGIDRFKTEYVSEELKKKATAEALDQVKSAIENTETGLVATAGKLEGVFVKVNPKLVGSDREFIGKGSGSVGVWTEYSARVEEDFSLGRKVDNLYTDLGKNAAAIQTINEVMVDKTQSLAESITNIDSKFESSVGSINTKLGTWTTSESSISDYVTNINSVVGKNSSSIQVQGKSIDGLSSQYTVKLDTNGRVSGFGLASNPNNQASSEFAVVADKFYIASPNNTSKGKSLFQVVSTPEVIGSVTVPAGVYMDGAFVKYASIDTAHIRDGAIVNAKIFNLDATKITSGFISADRIDAGSIRSDHLQVGSVTEAKFSPTVLSDFLTNKQFVLDSISDNVLTASEKNAVKTSWEQIKSNFNFYVNSAKIFNITLNTPAYTALSNYITTLGLNSTDSTQINSDVFKAKFNDWYLEEASVRTAIDTKVKEINDASLNQAKSATDLLQRWKLNKNNTLYIDDNRIAVNTIAAENIAADSITADKIKFGSVTSKTLSEDVRTDISKGTSAYKTVANKAESSALLSLDHDVRVIDGKVQAYGESITSLSADLSNKVGKGDVNSIISESQNGKKHIVSTEGLDNNLYYPVTIAVTGLFSKISMLISLGEAKASWATHGAGWSCGLTVTQRANGWGSNSPDLTIEKFDYAWTNQSPVINVGHLGTMSSALFYVRGGSKYHFYVDSNCYAPQLWTEKKIFYEQYNIYVEPITYSSGLEPKSLKQNVQANAVATSTLRANVDEINGKVVAQSSSILNLQTNVDTIGRDLTTKANSSVLAKYYTRDEADRATAGKIENFNSSFEIGGRNYFRKTTPLNPHQLLEVRRDLPDTPNGFYVVGSQTPSNNLRLPRVITGNGKWTISGWVRGSENTAISFFIDICDKELSKQIVINKDGSNSWEKFTYTVTVDNYSSDTYNFVDISSLSWAYFFFKDIKIEKGSKATDWTPAPEDIDQKFAETDANIKNTYITKSDATQAISSAKTELNSSYNKSLMDSRADGVNLINFSKMVPGYFSADGSIGQAATDHMDMNYYSCIGDESFTCRMSTVTGPVGGVGRVLWYDSNKILISSSDCNWTGTYTPYTFKSPVNARFYRYSMIGKYPAARIKLERGTASTGFSFSDLDESFYRVLLIQALSGNQLLSNPDFRDNYSGVINYDNAGTGRVILARVPKDPDNPSNSSHQLNCTISAGAAPGYGGFVFPVISKYNGLFATKIVMKVPVGYIVNIASNALPEGTDYRIIGLNEGTGKYETYTILCKCGTTGAQSSFGYVYFIDKSVVKLSGTQTDIVKISKLEAFDATSDKPMVSKANLDEYKQTVANQYGAISEDVKTISTKVKDNEAAIKVQAQSINGINAQYTIKTDVNGKVAGIGLVNSGKSSEFAVTADTFRVSNGSTDIAPFTISNNEILFNGKVSFKNVTDKGWKITLIGTSAALPTTEQYSGTYIDNGNYTEDFGTSGVRVVIYDVNKNVQLDGFYSTSTAAGCTSFKNAVINLNLDTLIVTMRSVGSSLANNQDLISAVNKLGFDCSSLNSALTYNTKTSFCGISQFIAAKNSINNIMFINADVEGKQQKAIASATIKDGVLIPDSIPMDTGEHKLNEAADIAIDTLTPGIGVAQATANSKSKTFTAQPTIPYAMGDLWKNGTTVLVSTTTRTTGSFTSADWIKVGDVTSENTAKDTSLVNGVSAATVATNAQTGKTLSDNIMSDLVITPVEKSGLSNEWNRIKAEYATLSTQATALVVDKAALDTAYTALNGTTPKIEAEVLISMTANYTLTAATRDAFKAKLNTYYQQATAVSKNITNTVNSLAATAQSTANSKAKTFTTTPTIPYSLGDVWKNGSAIYVSTVNRLTGSYTAADWVLVGDVTANNTSADTSKVNGISAATVTANASKGLEVYDDVMSDLKITPVEKTAISQEWKRIQAEYAKYLEQATSLGLSTSAYSSAYTALATTDPAMSTILASMTTTTTLTAAQRDAYRSQYTAYYTQTANIVKDINSKIATNADTNAKTIVSNIRLGGTNLFPKTLIKRGYHLSSGDLSAFLTTTNHITYDQFLSTGSNTNLIYQVWNDAAITSANTNRVCFYNSSKTYISQVIIPVLAAGTPYQILKIAIPETAAFVKLGAIAGASSYNDNIKIKFEFGDNPTDWSIAPEDIQNKLEAFVTNNTGNLLNNTVFSGTTDKWSTGTVTNQAFFNTTVPVHTITTTGDVLSASDKFTVDPSKAYEVSAWFKADSAVGSLYLGLYAYNKDGTNIGLNEISRATGANSTTANTNFYFQSISGAGLPLDWVKWVGYIMPAGTSASDMKGIGNTTSNARMLPNTAQMQVRWLNYYDGGTSTTKWAANFKCVEVDPNSIIAGVGAKYIADSKAEVYTTTPTTPYSVGDIWKNGTTVYVCTVAKASGAAYSVSDWIKAGDVTAENTSKDVVSVNGVAAATVVNNAQAGKTLSDNVMSDLVITPVEKSSLLTEWNRIKAEYTNLYAQAIALNISTVDFSAAYTALDGTTPRISSEVLASMVTNYTLTIATRDALRAKLNTYFSKAIDMSVNITAKINMSAATAQNTADSKAKVFTATPTVPYTIGDVWRNGNSLYVTTVNRLTGTYTAADWVKVSDLTSENVAKDVVSVNGTAAATVVNNASKGLEVYDDVMSDLKITPIEKTAINQEWNRIQQEYASLIAQATSLSVSTTTLTAAYNGLSTTDPAMSTILSSMSKTTTLTAAQRDAYKVQYTTYYTQAVAMVKAINEKIASNAKADLDNLEIGGVNVLTNSEEERTSLAATNKEYLMYERSKVLKDFYDENLGKPITISFEIKVPVAGAVQVYSSNGSAHNWSVGTPTLVANTWTKVVVKGIPQKHSSTPTNLASTLEFYGTYDTGRIPTVRRVKVESGNKATAWTASPAEINSAIASKSKTFITTPTTPYTIGDIFKNGSTIYVCTVARLTGAYTTSDWTLAGDVTANNTSADTAKVNGVAAATVATNAQAGKTLSDNVMSDLIITPVEKSALLTEWNRIKAEYTSIVAQATALSVDKTALTTAYTALDTTSPKIASEILANMTTNYILTTATRDTFKAQLNTYFVQATAVSKAITDKVNSLLGTAQNTADSKAKVFTSTPTVPYSVGDIWRNGNTVYVSSVTRATGSYTAADWTKASDVTSENTSANTSKVGSVSADSVATLVSDISNDSKLTAAEKRALNAEWERIKNTYPALITQAVNLQATYTRTAYDALAAYIPSLALTSQPTTDIVATTFRTNFSNYYVEEATILKNIQDKQRTNVTAAIDTAATDATNKANAVRDAIPELIFAQGGYADANALVTINGVNQTYTAATGVLVMVINQLTGVVETKTIYTADPTGFSTMKTAITAVVAGKIVVMVSRQNIPMTTDTNFRDVLRLIGSTDIIYNQYTRKTNNTFAIIGARGGIEGSANEAVVSVDGNMNLDNATTSGTLIAGKLSPNSTTFIDGGLILTDSINANSIKAGSVTAAQMDTRNLTIKDSSGNILFGSGTKLNVSNVNGLGSLATINKLTTSNITTYIDGVAVKNLLVGTAQIDNANIANLDAAKLTTGYISADRINVNTITGDKIKANTEINAPTIKGGNINIGNGNFVVDQWGNLNANSGTFRGTVLAENISGRIDVKSLKKSAIMSGYKMYFAMDQVSAGTTLQKDFHAYMVDIVFYNKKYEWLSADYVSRGAISYYYGTKGADVGAICFSLTVECVKPKTITQKVLTVDDYVDLVIESLSGVEIHKQLNIGYGRVSKEVSFTLDPGTYVINYVLRNTGWGPCSVNIVGDIIDNDSIFFA